MTVKILNPEKDIEGVNPAVAQRIYDMLSKDRRRFGVSGSFMTHQIGMNEYKEKKVSPAKAKEWFAAENVTSKAIMDWMKDKENVVLIDSAWVPDGDPEPESVEEDQGVITGVDTDHILIIGDEVLLIDTACWPKKKSYSISEDGLSLMTKKEFPYSDVYMEKGIFKWYEYLHESASVRSYVCVRAAGVSEEESGINVIRDRNWFTQVHYRLIQDSRFIEELDKRYAEAEDENTGHINTTLVAQCVVRCVKPYDERSKVITPKGLTEMR